MGYLFAFVQSIWVDGKGQVRSIGKGGRVPGKAVSMCVLFCYIIFLGVNDDWY